MVKLPAWALFTALSSAAMATTPGHLPFITDDYARARAEAIKGKRPLFVEVGAPW